MKVIFVGPSLSASAMSGFRSRLEFRGPARFGDIARAVAEGAETIGLIDGYFGDCAAVWHKEILYALSLGVRVYGAASMGALRAAECARFGMIGIGEVFERYASGDIIDDDAVAQVHAPAELGYAALSEPLVNIEATCHDLLSRGLISADEAAAVVHSARTLFFKERSAAAAIQAAENIGQARKDEMICLFDVSRVNLKEIDALKILQAIDRAPFGRYVACLDWQFRPSSTWRAVVEPLLQT